MPIQVLYVCDCCGQPIKKDRVFYPDKCPSEPEGEKTDEFIYGNIRTIFSIQVFNTEKGAHDYEPDDIIFEPVICKSCVADMFERYIANKLK